MRKSFLIALAAVATTLVVIALIRTWNGEWPYPSSVQTLEQRGQFGDSFAIFSAALSAFGFIVLVLTLALQQAQISQQASELKRQADRDEANRKRDEIIQYENLLFRLLSFYKESVESIRITRRGVTSDGRDALSRVLEQMQTELRRRRLHFINEREMGAIRSGSPTDLQRSLFEYVAVENCRVIQYIVVYQRRFMATLQALLFHLENRCPVHADIGSYRELVSSQITHVEVQYIFAMTLIHENESVLRDLLVRSGLFDRDSAPYNFKLHQYLYQHFWGQLVGDPSKARKLAFRPKKSDQIRQAALESPLSDLLKKYGIGSPVTPEGMSHADAQAGKGEGESDA